MKFILLAALCAVALSAPAHGPYEGQQIWRVVPETASQVEWLKDCQEQATLEVDFWGTPFQGRPLFLRVKPEAQEDFSQMCSDHGVEYTVVVNNLQVLVDRERPLAKFWPRGFAFMADEDVVGSYVTSSPMLGWMDKMASRYSEIFSVVNIGTSYEGRPLKVGKVSSGSGRPAIFINSGFHPREYIAHASMVWILNELITKYGQDESVTSLVDKFDWYIMPLANPDGYDFTFTSGNRFWRKTRSRTYSASCPGVDPNRNFDAEFGGVGTSTNACSDIYRGPRAFSEVETASMARFLEELGSDLVMYVDVHAFSQLWMTPYGYDYNARPSNADEIDRVANIGAEAIRSVNGKRFRVGTPPQLLYPATGGSFDWVKMKLGVKYAYAFELRPDSGSFFGFVVPEREIPDSGRETLAGLAAAANALKLD